MIRVVRTLFGKELREILRDQRTLFASLNFALAGPFVLVAVVYGIAAANRAVAAGPFTWCAGSIASTTVRAYLENEGYRFAPSAPVCLSVPDDLASRMHRSRQVDIDVRADLLQHEAAAKRLVSDLEAFGGSIGAARLVARGIAPGVERPLRVTLQNTAPVSSTGNSVISVLALYFVLAPFFASLASAIDTTAGERERGTLEPLLVQPISSVDVVLSKWLSLSVLGLLGTAVTVTLGLWSLRAAPLADAGVTIDLAPLVIAQAVLVVAPLAFLVAALQMWVGLQAKTYKEGQNYLTLIAFLPMVLGVTAVKDVPERFRSLPLVHEVVTLKSLLWGQSPPIVAPSTMLLALLAIVVFLALAAARLRRAALVHA
jgi:sodium transport system permease protein